MNPVPAPAASPLISDAGFPLLKEYVIAQTGLSYYADKDGDLARCLAPHLAARGLNDCVSYLTLLRDPAGGAAELDDLIKDLTIGETFFFRHAELFEALRTVVLPDLIARKREQRRLRIWSAGCATGAEPYSLSILFRRDLANELAGWEVSIVGTDINREFLARASAGVFEEWALRTTSEEMRRECFTKVGPRWAIQPRFQEGVSFQYHNLVTHPFPSLLNNLFAFDLILCRNVLIYFKPDLTQRVLDGFHQCLVEGGWLLVGHAEPNVQLFQAYTTVNAAVGAVLYQKLTGPTAPTQSSWSQPPVSTLQATPQAPRVPPPARTLPPAPELGRKQSAAKKVVAAAAPPPAPAPPAPPGSAEEVRPVGLDAVRALADGGAWEQALNGCRNLLATDKLSPLVHLYHGMVLEQTGRHAEADQALRRAVYLDRRCVLGHYYLGLLLQKSHQPEQAVRSFRNVLALLPRLGPDHVFIDGDGITAAELAKLTRMQLAILEGA